MSNCLLSGANNHAGAGTIIAGPLKRVNCIPIPKLKLTLVTTPLADAEGEIRLGIYR